MPCQNSSWIVGSRIYREGENSDSSEFTRYDKSSGTRSRIDRVYADIKIANNIKINHIMVYFADRYNIISLDRLPSKTKIGKDLIIIFTVNPSSPQRK